MSLTEQTQRTANLKAVSPTKIAMSERNAATITVKRSTFLALKEHGRFGESWDDVLSRLAQNNNNTAGVGS